MTVEQALAILYVRQNNSVYVAPNNLSRQATRVVENSVRRSYGATFATCYLCEGKGFSGSKTIQCATCHGTGEMQT